MTGRDFPAGTSIPRPQDPGWGVGLGGGFYWPPHIDTLAPQLDVDGLRGHISNRICPDCRWSIRGALWREQTSLLPSARSREGGVATEMLLTKAKQVSDDGGCAAWITP